MRPSKLVKRYFQSMFTPLLRRLAAPEVNYGTDGSRRKGEAQSRKSSLIEVLERVFSSTRLTITAQ
jgi:hypothetical protein